MSNLSILNTYFPNEILRNIREYIGPHKIAKIFTHNINKIEIISKDEPFQDLMFHFYRPVSYTHLTLPTICSV